MDYLSKNHNKFLFPVPAGGIYGSFCKADNEISNTANHKKDPPILTRQNQWILITLLFQNISLFSTGLQPSSALSAEGYSGLSLYNIPTVSDSQGCS